MGRSNFDMNNVEAAHQALLASRDPERLVIPKTGLFSLKDIRSEIIRGLSPEDQQKIAGELVLQDVRVSPKFKISCPFADCCRSPSKKVSSGRLWVCGNNSSSSDRMDCCVEYRRLLSGLKSGQSGNRRFPK